MSDVFYSNLSFGDCKKTKLVPKTISKNRETVEYYFLTFNICIVLSISTAKISKRGYGRDVEMQWSNLHSLIEIIGFYEGENSLPAFIFLSFSKNV